MKKIIVIFYIVFKVFLSYGMNNEITEEFGQLNKDDSLIYIVERGQVTIIYRINKLNIVSTELIFNSYSYDFKDHKKNELFYTKLDLGLNNDFKIDSIINYLDDVLFIDTPDEVQFIRGDGLYITKKQSNDSIISKSYITCEVDSTNKATLEYYKVEVELTDFIEKYYNLKKGFEYFFWSLPEGEYYQTYTGGYKYIKKFEVEKL